jgi:O-methyltransferase
MQSIDALIASTKERSLLDAGRLSMLYKLARETLGAAIEGDVVECGVRGGGSAAVLGSAIQEESGRTLWLYDTFQGMPAPGKNDPPSAWEYVTSHPPSDSVVQAFLKEFLPEERLVLKPGLFEETFRQERPSHIALLHIDADWYESVLLCLRTLEPLVSPGGVIILDDFGHWEGTREAFYDFCAETGAKPLLERFGYTQAFWRKGRTTTREDMDRYPRGSYAPRA